MKILRKVLLIFACGILVATTAFFGYYFFVTKDVSLDKEKLLTKSSDIVVCDAFDNVIPSANMQEKQRVSLKELPPHVQYAFIDTEDRNFFSHHGFDYPRIAKAFVKNLSARSFQQGASTISQQLIKNTHLSQEKTLKRKLQEWKLTRELEKRYSKRDILENYLSVIYFGHNCFGLHSASTFYFGKTPAELTLGESCVLAGLVKSPNNYSPFKAPEKCLKRKRVVLSIMQKNGHATKEETAKALQETLPNSPTVSAKAYGYAHQVFDELSEIAENHGIVLGGKIRIKTYCDLTVQSVLENVANTDTGTDKTLAVIDAEHCGYKAYVSSVDTILRSPASLLKPLLVYAPAIEENLLSPSTPILDEPVNFSGYAPQNYNHNFHGYVSARDCLAKSLNVPAVKILNSVGLSKSTAYLEKLGLHVEKEDCSLALALGGMKNGFLPQNVFSAYTVFVNGGNFQPSRFIQSISMDGKRVYENRTQTTRVFSEETAYLTADMLRTAVENGTAKKLRPLSTPIYAKTGTAGTENGNTDAYTVAFTQKDVIGVWLGNKNRSVISHTGGGLPCNLIYELQTRLNEYYQRKGIRPQPLAKPEGVVEKHIDRTIYETQRELVLADPLSPASYQIKALFKRSQIPTKTSEMFSNPSIVEPSIALTESGVRITLFNQPLYRYKIIRYDSDKANKSSVVYNGEYLPQFIDENVEKDKKYVYAVIPYYQSNVGKEIRLPIINTQGYVFTKQEEKKILEKDWWEY